MLPPGAGAAAGLCQSVMAICCSPSTTGPDVTEKQSSPNTRRGIVATPGTWHRRAPPFTLDRTPGRRLRVGYVSPDFRQHAVAMFAEPLLAAHDRSNVELYLYSGVAAEDAATERFRSLSDHWRSTIGLSDAQLAEQIRADQIDVLVDLAGHSAGNRLTDIRAPAGAGAGGVSAGARLHHRPVGHGRIPCRRHPGSRWRGRAVQRTSDAPAAHSACLRATRRTCRPLHRCPALANGFVTFGHFGRTERLNDTVIATWARILHAVPRSRLVLNNRPFQEAAFRETVPGALRHAWHRPPTGSIWSYSAPQPSVWAAYGGIDIALDPFPHNAGTTTIEALWQGVPVVITGRAADSRSVRCEHPARGRAGRLGSRYDRRLR